MFNNNKNTAILLFTNASSKEASRKRIAGATHLFEHLTQQTFLEAKKTGLDVILFSDKLQKGNTFGERFSNAIAKVFEQGYQHIITIGNDSPGLHQQQLRLAAKNLQQQQNTLGPSLDGGVYLIALSKQQFHKESFAALPWQTAGVLTALQQYLSNTNRQATYLLTPLKDLDAKQDLAYFLKKYKQTKLTFVRILIALLQSKTKAFYYQNSFVSYYYTKFLFNKGSPLLY